jgi:hypothetical protein
VGVQAAPPAVGVQAPASSSEPSPHRSGLTGLQWGGVAVGAAGLVGIGVGAAFGFVAMAKNNDSKSPSECSPMDQDLCTAAGRHDRSAAITAGNISTVGLIAGGVLAAGGVTMILVGKPKEAASVATTVEAAPMVGAQVLGGVIQGRF